MWRSLQSLIDFVYGELDYPSWRGGTLGCFRSGLSSLVSGRFRGDQPGRSSLPLCKDGRGKCASDGRTGDGLNLNGIAPVGEDKYPGGKKPLDVGECSGILYRSACIALGVLGRDTPKETGEACNDPVLAWPASRVGVSP